MRWRAYAGVEWHATSNGATLCARIASRPGRYAREIAFAIPHTDPCNRCRIQGPRLSRATAGDEESRTLEAPQHMKTHKVRGFRRPIGSNLKSKI